MKASISISRSLFIVFISISFLLFLTPARCLSQPPEPNWLSGPQTIDLGDNIAQVDLENDYQFADAEDTNRLLEYYGHLPGKNILGCIVPKRKDSPWSIVLEYFPVGYIQDDEKNNIDYSATLRNIKRAQGEVNKRREKKGLPPIDIIGWHEKPHYDSNLHNLVWTLLGEMKGNRLAYYNVRLLGRYGYMSFLLNTELSMPDDS